MPIFKQSGHLEGTGAAFAFPEAYGQWLVVTGDIDNVGLVYIGKTGVTIPGAANNTTSGPGIGPGVTVVLPLGADSLATNYMIAAAGDGITYGVY